MQSDFYDRYEPNTKRLRTFLREQLDVFLSSTGNIALEPESLDLQFNEAEEELSRDASDRQSSAEELFDGECTRSLFTLAIEQLHNFLESQGKLQHFRIFQRYDLQDRSSSESASLELVAQEFSLPLSDVALYLNDARQSLRSIILDLLRSFTSSDEEFRREARSLLGL